MCFYIESQNATDNKNCITEYSHRKTRMKFSTCKINPLVHQPNISNLMREQAPSEGCMPYILALSTEARLHPGFHSLVRPIGLTGHPPRMAMHDRLLGPSKQKAESLSQFYLHESRLILRSIRHPSLGVQLRGALMQATAAIITERQSRARGCGRPRGRGRDTPYTLEVEGLLRLLL